MALLPVLAASVLLLIGCDSQPLNDPGPSSPIAVTVVFTPVGDTSSFSAQLNGQTYTRPGQSIVNLAPGTYQVSGAFAGSGFSVGFQTLGNAGGVESGSLRSLTGPSPRITACGITYASQDAAASQTFQLRFQITSDAKSACAGGPP